MFQRASFIAAILGVACATQDERMGGGPGTPAPAAPQVVVVPSNERMIPAGTTLPISADERIDTSEPVAGKTFAASLAADVKNRSGEILAPRGSPVELIVTQVSQDRTVRSNEIQLALSSITINGVKYTPSTEEEKVESEDEGIGMNPRTGVFIGGGAALGTVIGAIAGGTRGAVVGGVLGAGAGAAAQVLTKGDRVQVPQNTLLEFRIEQPIQLQTPEQELRG